MEILVSENNIQIKDSGDVKKSRFDAIIDRLYTNLSEHKVVKNRTKSSIKNEWAVHNLFYLLKIATARTKDLDINYPQKTYEKIIYQGLGWLCMLLIP